MCTVDVVDVAARTCDCTPVGGDATTAIPGVRLMGENNDGFLVIPSVGSTVMVALSNRGLSCIYMFSDIDQVLIFLGESPNYTSFTMKSGEQMFNDGSFGGLTKVVELTQKLNNLENAFNQLVAIYNAHVHTGGTMSGSTGVPTAIDTNTLTPTTRAEIENTLVKHGK